MVRISLIAWLILACSFLVNAQFSIPEINKLKSIKLLKSYRYEVQNILSDFELQNTDEEYHSQRFSTENYSVEVRYSNGNCVDDSDTWNVPEWIVTKIEIEPRENAIPIDKLGFDLSKLNKERHFEDRPSSFVYFDKEMGIAFEVDEKSVWKIILFGAANLKIKSCENDEGKKFTSSKKWFVDSKLKWRIASAEAPAPSVSDLNLSRTDFEYSLSNKQIIVITTTSADADDVITYQYIVSAGKIVGSGPKVIWDLSGVQPGNYTITAGVDDGCGICGKTVTRTVTIR